MRARESRTELIKRPRRSKSGPARGTLAGEMLYLQQTAGNQAVTELVSRMPVQRAADSATVQRDGHPEQFPLEEETVMRAVQRRATGLAKGGEVKAYVASVKKAKGTWATLKTPAARAQMLGKLANDRLAQAGVLQVAIRIDPGLSAQTNGQFDFTTWSIALNGALVNRTSLTDAQLKSVAGTIYHEARHAEQWYRIARWLAGQGKKASAIATEMQIAPTAAAAAYANPLAEHGWFFRLTHSADELEDNQTKLDEAKAWFDNIYGSGATNRNAVLNALDPDATAYLNASKTHNAAAAKTAAAAKRYQAARRALTVKEGALAQLSKAVKASVQTTGHAEFEELKAHNVAAAKTAATAKRYQAARRTLSVKEGALAQLSKAVKASVQTTGHAEFEELKAHTAEVRAQRLAVARLRQAWVNAQKAEANAAKALADATTKTQTGYQAYRGLIEEADAWALTAQVESGF